MTQNENISWIIFFVCTEILEVMEYSQSEPCHLEAITEMGHSLSPGSDEIASGTMMNIYYRSTERAIVTVSNKFHLICLRNTYKNTGDSQLEFKA